MTWLMHSPDPASAERALRELRRVYDICSDMWIWWDSICPPPTMKKALESSILAEEVKVGTERPWPHLLSLPGCRMMSPLPREPPM